MKNSASIISSGRTKKLRAQQTSLAFLHLLGAAPPRRVQIPVREAPRLQQLRVETSSTLGKDLSVSRSWQRTPPGERTSISPPETHSRRSFMYSARPDVFA